MICDKKTKFYERAEYKNVNLHNGGAIIMVLVFSAVFAMTVGALSQFVLQQNVLGRGKVAKEQAIQIAEAGIEYYKWRLAHNPDKDSETVTVEYKDPDTGDKIGEFTIISNVNKQCGVVMHRDIDSTGVSYLDTRFERTVSARYMLPSVANYSAILNAGVWYGSSSNVIGPIHSNEGIRMDGVHNSTVSSAVPFWTCDYDFGCNPAQTKDGVWGLGGNPALWKYPDGAINFTQMNIDFADLKVRAQNSGRYFPSVSNGAGNKGYRIVFKSDGTFDMYRVDNAQYNWGWESGWRVEKNYHTIVSETFMGNYTIPNDCALIFVEDQTWVEGSISGKIALVAADVDRAYDPDIILHNNLVQATGAPNDGLTMISERNILISAKSAEDLTIEAIMVTPNGKIGRNHYVETPGYYYADAGNGLQFIYMNGVGNKQDLNSYTFNGTIVSDERSGLKWTYSVYKYGYGYDIQISGFVNRNASYERVLALDPPPFAPSVSTVPYYSAWRER